MTTIKVPKPPKENLESKFLKIQEIKSDPKKYQAALRALIDGPLKKAQEYKEKLFKK